MLVRDQLPFVAFDQRSVGDQSSGSHSRRIRPSTRRHRSCLHGEAGRRASAQKQPSRQFPTGGTAWHAAQPGIRRHAGGRIANSHRHPGTHQSRSRSVPGWRPAARLDRTDVPLDDADDVEHPAGLGYQRQPTVRRQGRVIGAELDSRPAGRYGDHQTGAFPVRDSDGVVTPIVLARKGIRRLCERVSRIQRGLTHGSRSDGLSRVPRPRTGLRHRWRHSRNHERSVRHTTPQEVANKSHKEAVANKQSLLRTAAAPTNIDLGVTWSAESDRCGELPEHADSAGCWRGVRIQPC